VQKIRDGRGRLEQVWATQFGLHYSMGTKKWQDLG